MKSALRIPTCGREGRKAGSEKKKTLSYNKVSTKGLASPSRCSEARMALRVVCRWGKGSEMYLLYPNVDQSLDVGYTGRDRVTLDKISVFSQRQFF